MKIAISLAQIDVHEGDISKNLEKGEVYIKEAASRGSDLIVFPELWTTGFNWAFNAKNAKEHEIVPSKIQSLAKKYKIAIHGSTIALNPDNSIANRSELINNQGEIIARYDKIHLFSLVGEHKHISPGKKLSLVDSPWGPVGLSICYDIRFPELFRSYAIQGARMILCPIAFPHPRLEHWRILSRARAIENQLFMVSVNQVGYGPDRPGDLIEFFGSSSIIDPWGEVIVEASQDKEELLSATIDLKLSNEIREKMHVLKDRRPETYQL